MTVILPHTAYSVSLTLDGRMTSVLGNLYKFKYRAKLLLSYCLKLSQCTVLMYCIFGIQATTSSKICCAATYSTKRLNLSFFGFHIAKSYRSEIAIVWKRQCMHWCCCQPAVIVNRSHLSLIAVNNDRSEQSRLTRNKTSILIASSQSLALA